jgi:GDP-4-dehydro-6-deoxy-D-mannose reductase
MRVLITGAAGFVGRHLARHLRAAGHTVVGLDSPLHPEALRWSEDAGLDLREADVADRHALFSRLAEVHPDAVVHLAAVSSVADSLRDPLLTWRVNLTGTLNLLDAVREHTPGARVLVVSTSEVYGRVLPEAQPITEDHPLRPVTPYAASKAAADLAAFQYAAAYGLDVVRVRPFNHTGPGQSDRFVCSNFARQVAELEKRAVRDEASAAAGALSLRVGNLDAERDFTDVRDVVRAYELALLKGERGAVYNLAGGRPRPVRWVAETLVRLARVRIEIVRDPARERPVDLPLVCGSADRFAALTGWQPAIPLDQTLADLLDDWRRRV